MDIAIKFRYVAIIYEMSIICTLLVFDTHKTNVTAIKQQISMLKRFTSLNPTVRVIAIALRLQMSFCDRNCDKPQGNHLHFIKSPMAK